MGTMLSAVMRVGKQAMGAAQRKGNALVPKLKEAVKNPEARQEIMDEAKGQAQAVMSAISNNETVQNLMQGARERFSNMQEKHPNMTERVQEEVDGLKRQMSNVSEHAKESYDSFKEKREEGQGHVTAAVDSIAEKIEDLGKEGVSGAVSSTLDNMKTASPFGLAKKAAKLFTGFNISFPFGGRIKSAVTDAFSSAVVGSAKLARKMTGNSEPSEVTRIESVEAKS